MRLSDAATTACGTQDHDADETVLDVRGLMCPLPVLKTKVALNRLPSGSRLRVYTTDSHSVIDFEAYCARSGHKLIERHTKDETYVFVIRKR